MTQAGTPIDHRTRATNFHRRAQAAEAVAAKATEGLAYWRAEFLGALRSKRTMKRKLNRARARLRAVRWADPLTRIVEIGRMFP